MGADKSDVIIKDLTEQLSDQKKMVKQLYKTLRACEVDNNTKDRLAKEQRKLIDFLNKRIDSTDLFTYDLANQYFSLKLSIIKKENMEFLSRDIFFELEQLRTDFGYKKITVFAYCDGIRAIVDKILIIIPDGWKY